MCYDSYISSSAQHRFNQSEDDLVQISHTTSIQKDTKNTVNYNIQLSYVYGQAQIEKVYLYKP